MADAELDVKKVVDRMEQNEDGCSLLFNEAFQLLNKDYEGQMKLLAKVEDEAKSRPDNKLTFEHIDETGWEPKRKQNLHYEGVNILRADGKPIFQEIKTSIAENNHTLVIQRTCKPGKS